jgi:glycosyltransferase involved in cell wall biosynthesis
LIVKINSSFSVKSQVFLCFMIKEVAQSAQAVTGEGGAAFAPAFGGMLLQTVLTVLFASHDGVLTLPGVLDAYQRLQKPRGGWKLVVVDNASIDRTSAILKSYRDRLPLTCLAEPARGKNRALNTGLSEISGDLVVLTDDDVFPRSDWLIQLEEAAERHPECSIFGGTILPRWEIPPDDWILAWVPLGLTFALTDPSWSEGPTTSDRIFGPNMVVRSEIFRAGRRFDASIGPRGQNYAMGSESQLTRALIKEGHAAWHCPNAVVEHFIRRTQLQKSWILGRAVRFGRGQFRLSQQNAPKEMPCWNGVPRYLFRSLARERLRWLSAGLRWDAEQLFRSQWEISYLRGMILEARQLSQAGRTH